MISSVLMIAFVIVLFVVISSFVQRTSETAIEGSEGQVSRVVECATTTLDVDYACADKLDVSPTFVKLDVDNGPDSYIKSLKIRVVGDNGIQSITYNPTNDVAPFDRILSRSLSQPVTEEIGVISRIEVIPEVESGLCGSSVKGTSNIKLC